MIIALEGGDAVGKHTQSKILTERLDATLFTFPDYTTVAGKMILGNLTGEWGAARIDRKHNGLGQEYVEHYGDPERNAIALQSLMLTNRMERGADLRAALARGHVVLDRYDASARVYGGLDGVDQDWLRLTNAELPVRPDLYILLDAPVDVGFQRRPERRDRYERDRPYLERVRAAYLELFRAHKHERDSLTRAQRWKLPPMAMWEVVDATQSIESVAARIAEIVGVRGSAFGARTDLTYGEIWDFWKQSSETERAMFNVAQSRRGAVSFCCIGCGCPSDRGVSRCPGCP